MRLSSGCLGILYLRQDYPNFNPGLVEKKAFRAPAVNWKFKSLQVAVQFAAKINKKSSALCLINPLGHPFLRVGPQQQNSVLAGSSKLQEYERSLDIPLEYVLGTEEKYITEKSHVWQSREQPYVKWKHIKNGQNTCFSTHQNNN